MTEQQAWQRGISMEVLREIADVFRASDEGFVRGAFTGMKERDVAAAIAEERLATWRVDGVGVTAAVVYRQMRAATPVRDFTGETRARMEVGDWSVSRVGALPGYESGARMLIQRLAGNMAARQALFVQVWQESEQHAEILRPIPLSLVAVKIPASSELVGVYAMGKGGRLVENRGLPVSESWGLRQLALEVPEPLVAAAVDALYEKAPPFAPHYSGYNKRGTWTALALRGFGEDPAAWPLETAIEKPAEMSKKWKAEHPGWEKWTCRNTELRGWLPELEPLIELVPGEHQRIRLMALAPGGGELTRHADIIDREAGTGHRKVLRIHLPLVSNPQVTFSSWTVLGERYEVHMRPGTAWYLDTRKPHTAVNAGETERLHLVVDAYSSPELLALLAAEGSAA